MTTRSLITPPRLRPGDTIGVIAPSSPQRDDERLRRGIFWLRSCGFDVRDGAHLWNRFGYLAGSDRERLSDLNEMIADPAIAMIVAGRGGYGATRILDGIDYDGLRRSPKIILGFSDVTAITMAQLGHAGVVGFSGAMPGVDLWQSPPDEYAVTSMLQTLTSDVPLGTIVPPAGDPDIEGMRPGSATGPLIAANLTLLATLCGTPYLPDMTGAILLIEEIGEESYRVDRLLSQLRNAGILDAISGLAYGAFTGSEPRRVSVEPLPMELVLADYAAQANVPTIRNVPYGHIDRKLTLPVGVMCRIDGTHGTMEMLESGVG